MLNLEYFLILFPLVAAVLLLILRKGFMSGLVNIIASILIAGASILLLITGFNSEPAFFSAHFPWVDKAMILIEIIIGLYILWISVKAKQWVTLLLLVVQMTALLYFEFTAHPHAQFNLFIDKFSIIMALIIGIIGTLICIYAIGYMKDFAHHQEGKVQDRRGFFFFTLFIFLSAMFGIVFSNNLLWLFFFWEITTLCSFLLIGYKQDEVSKQNAFRALKFNLVGGVGFIFSMIYLFHSFHIIELDKMLTLGSLKPVLFVAAGLALAGITKSAQMPFSKWLLGAMVAPTPVSALLHSSTMVKAGVYLIVKLSPIFQNTYLGYFVALVGGVTFVITSFLAISQSDAKKVLAYSTIANLGLIVMCGGMGTYEAVWAAIFLIIFHAMAKCLLFLCVGTIEHKLESRNIEDMSGLIRTLPKLSVMMQIGIAGMFLAPFGMLISKWAVLKAIVDLNPLLAVFLIFGGSATLFFWIKWLGKLIITEKYELNVENRISPTIWTPLFFLAAATIITCAIFPIVSHTLVIPYIMFFYGNHVTDVISQGNMKIMLIMLGMLALFPISLINYKSRVKVVSPYLGGTNNPSDSTQYFGSAGKTYGISMKNYYMENIFGEEKLFNPGVIAGVTLLIIMFGVCFL